MSLPTDLETVRRNTNTTSSDYSDVEVQAMIDAYGIPCTTAQIWQWELSKLTKRASGLSSSTLGIETQKYQDLSKTVEYYQSQYDYWKSECEKASGIGASRILKVAKKSVAGIVTEDDLESVC